MNQDDNPYAAPRADIDAAALSEQEPTRVFSLDGRIGRWRFTVYGLVGTIIFSLLLGTLFGIAISITKLPFSLDQLFPLAFLPVLALARRRLHDMNASAWWVVLAPLGLVPVIALLLVLFLMLYPGSAGPNRFGAPPSPNSAWLNYGGLSLSLAALAWLMFSGRVQP